ncbi:hypothetical protein SAMN02799622_02029 [Methylobacterium sp. UNC378MF]|uniref:hypothetical protein n=1 Tax=Methylobacterium sp. UNC378MF TaxID=1502748 RepID=UPI0008876BB9|nr:hypothetical protein [Methylobacterium sp. UNC378MF]SDA18434.1 hypothetical protein SAMN02799622_02029 [Methylobacterium sp. UNC378MF]
MSDVYKVAVALQMSSNASAILGSLATHLIHAHHQVDKLNKGLNDTTSAMNRVKLAIGGGLAIAGGTAALAVVGKMVDKGNELIKIQQNMAAAGVKSLEIQEAYAEAWKLTGKYTNVSAADALKTISEARMTFGSQEAATHHAEDFVKMTSFLKAYQGGAHGKGATNFEAEAIAAMKSGEIAGKIDPKDMAEHVKQMTAMRVAYGDQLKIGQYLTAQRAGGVALRNVSDDFRYGVFPALVQENGPNAGVMIMTAFNKLVAGTGNKLEALSAMSSLGLLDESKVTHHPLTGKVTRVEMGAVRGDKEFAVNPGEWVEKYLKPALDRKTSSTVEQAQWVSKILPDRNAAKAVTEMLQQWPKLIKDAQLMLQARKALNEGAYLDKSWEGQKQAFETQWTNFVQALGAPLVGVATENLKRVNEALSGWAQWAGKPEMAGTVEAVGKGIAVLGASLTAGGSVALIAALGPAGWIAAGIVGATAAFVAFREPFEHWLKSTTGMGPQLDAADKGFNRLAVTFGKWAGPELAAADAIFNKAAIAFGEWVKSITPSVDTIKSTATLLAAEITSWPGKLTTAIAEMGASLDTAIGDMLKSLFNKINPFSKTAFDGGDSLGGMIQKASFGGGANDNFGGSSGVARAVGRGGAFGPGTGAGNSWYEAIMRAEGTAGKDPYNVVLGNGRYGLPSKPLTDMSLAEAYQFGRSVRARHGSSSAIGAFQIVGQTMKTYMGEAGLGWNDKFSPENQRKLADVIRRHQGFGAWEGFKVHRGELGNARQMNPYGKDPAPTAGPPPQRQQSVHVHNLIVDGKKMAAVVTTHQAEKMRFPLKAGGMDTHGEWRAPGTPVMDAA